MFFPIKLTQGFTLIETLIGVLLTLVVCSALFLGMTQAKLYLESIRIKEKAYQELKNWTNEWKSMVAAGVSNFPNDGPGGERIPLKKDSQGNTIIEGKLFKKITKANESGQYSVFYNIETFITWSNDNFFFKSNTPDTLKFNTYQIQFYIQ